MKNIRFIWIVLTVLMLLWCVAPLLAAGTTTYESGIMAYDSNPSSATYKHWVALSKGYLLASKNWATGATFGNGYGGTGATLTALGAFSTKGAIICDDDFTAKKSSYFGTGYAGTGATLTKLGAFSTKGALVVDLTSTLAGDVTFGDGYAGTGATLTAAGAFSTNGALVVDGTSTLTGDVTIGTGYGGAGTGTTITALGAISTKGALIVDGATTLAAVSVSGAITGAGPKHYISVPMTCVANTTTNVGVFIAQRACTITKASIAFVAKPASAGGTVLFHLDNYDLSATTSDELMNADTVDLEALTNLTKSNLTLTATGADLVLAAGDVVYARIISNNVDMTAGTGGVLTLEYTLQ